MSDEDYDQFADVIGSAMSVAVDESIVLAKLENYFHPQPAKLVEGENKELQEIVDRLVQKLGGPPRVIILGNEDAKPKYDMYPSAAISEMIKVFYRARRSVTRAQMFLIGSSLLKDHPEYLNLSSDQEFTPLLQGNVTEVFWEHAETSYVRLASYWDRVGQVLDFVFFGIRHFEREGFKAVIDRIHNNICPVHKEITKHNAWKELRNFQTNETEKGLGWLLSRRNLIVHSLHLQPVKAHTGENELFDSAYNHLDEKFKKKLKPGTPKEEIEKINVQLSIAAKLFHHVLSLIEYYLVNFKEKA